MAPLSRTASTNVTKAKVIVINADTARRSAIFVELRSEEEALSLAKKLADGTSRTIVVQDDDGDVLFTVPGSLKN